MHQRATSLSLWEYHRRLEDPIANHILMSRCLYAYFHSLYSQYCDNDGPTLQGNSLSALTLTETTSPADGSDSTLPRHRYRKRAKLQGRLRRRRWPSHKPHKHPHTLARSNKETARGVSEVSQRLDIFEGNVTTQLGKLCSMIEGLEEKWEKEAVEQRCFLDCLQKELYAFKGSAYMRNNKSATHGVRSQGEERVDANMEKSAEMTENVTRMTNGMQRITEEGHESDEDDKTPALVPDPLEELLNRGTSRGIGFKLGQKLEKQPDDEDPILKLLTEESENKENQVEKVPEPVRPKNMMFRMQKANTQKQPPISMDDLLLQE